MAKPDNAEDDVSKCTPFQIKALLIESAMRNPQNNAMTTNITVDELERACSFDPDELESLDIGVPYYTGPDLHTALENLEYECERNAFLGKIAGFLNSRKDLQPEIIEMLDEELEQRGLAKYTDLKVAAKVKGGVCGTSSIVYKADHSRNS